MLVIVFHTSAVDRALWKEDEVQRIGRIFSRKRGTAHSSGILVRYTLNGPEERHFLSNLRTQHLKIATGSFRLTERSWLKSLHSLC